MSNPYNEPEWGGELMQCQSFKNLDKEPVQIEMVPEIDIMRSTDEKPVYYSVPTCPSCGEMPYNDKYCVFCGQRFVLPTEEEIEAERKAERERIIQNTTGVVYDEKEDVFRCSVCGTDLTKAKATTLLSHGDGIDFIQNTFKCNKCGNHIVRTHKF